MKYYILYKDENRGPLELSELDEFDLNPTSRVWAPGWPSWQNAGDVAEIMEYINMRETRAREEREAKIKADQEAKALKEAQDAKARKEAQEAKIRTEQHSTQAKSEAQPQKAKETEWFYAINNQQLGPVDEATMRRAGITPDTFVWNENLGPNWVRASSVPALQDLFAQQTPQSDPSNPSTSVTRTISTGEPHSGQHTANPDPETSSPYMMGIAGTICAVVAVIMCFVKGDYLDGEELVTIFALLALPACILGVASLVAANQSTHNSTLGEDLTACKRRGFSTGLGIGAIVCAILGIIIACKDFVII